jgi:predicted DNA-binding transcriptional regulator AlpA
LGFTEKEVWEADAAGTIPRPISIQGRSVWRIREIRAWLAEACPDRTSWEAKPSK